LHKKNPILKWLLTMSLRQKSQSLEMTPFLGRFYPILLILLLISCNEQITPTEAVPTAVPQQAATPTPSEQPSPAATQPATPFVAATETVEPTSTQEPLPTATPSPPATIPPVVIEVEDAILPPGFSMIRFAEVNRPTALAFDGEGRLYATTNDGMVIVFIDEDGDGRADSEQLFYEDFFIPLGITVQPGTADVYVSSRGQINILRDTNGDLRADENTLFIRGLPRDWHQNNNLKFGPDGMLYVTIGSTCDACQEEDPRSATIMRFDPETAEGEIIASGLRNPYDLAFHPLTGDLFATDNGRDDLGNEAPRDELNHIIEGQDYGWPDCWDELVGPGCEGTTAAIAFFEPRASTNSLDFYTGSSLSTGSAFPIEYQNVLFAAVFGSRVIEVDKGIAMITLAPNGRTYSGQTTWFARWPGAPLGLITGPDGALYVGDYAANLIYRISYGR
jgi:glucose/arabinose dehydrogenase